ncbi:MAG TPA: hypothetical protein VMS08_00965 [Candidatus Saccharimonadia bacterium]|nr:hypothetical protein [Candidatus Saccharimonadia bacterium]
MSINFQDPVNGEAMAKLAEAFGQPVATDKKTFLYDRIGAIEQRVMKEIANAAKQPTAVELNTVGDVKMIDGSPWRLTAHGWVRERESNPGTGK